MTEDEERALVVAEARSYCGTPWRHAQDLKHAGVDCAMLIVRSFVDTGMIAPFDPRPYPKAWFLHRDEPRFLEFVLDHSVEIESDPKPADIVLWRVGRQFAHGGIITAWPRVVHAYAQARIVLEEDISRAGIKTDTVRHPRRIFRLKRWM